MLCSFDLLSQNRILVGMVKDSSTNEPLSGVIIKASEGKATSSNLEGGFKIDVSPNSVLTISYVGYQSKRIDLREQKTEGELIIPLSTSKKEINAITVSGSRFAKRAAEEIVSIEVIKPNYIQNTANNAVDDALQRVTGVDVIENQVNIRGGSGWSYGAGSRVIVLVDDMPLLTSDAGDAKWDFMPIENCEQIEVLKGASSSLYGSSALNGVINFRTGFAKSKPKTKMMLYNGMWGNPKEKNWKWWDKQQPGFYGGYFSHSQKINQLDLVFGSAWYSEDSYLQGDLNRRGRANLNLRYRFKKLEGLVIGLNTNIQKNKSQTFFLWDTSANGILQPYGGLADSTTTINKNNGLRFNIDPYLTFSTKNGVKHTLRTRYFRSQNDIPEKQQSSKADTYYGEYQFFKKWQSENALLNELNVIGGGVLTHGRIEGELYGNHITNNQALYLQLEKKLQRKLWASLGARYEWNKVDTYALEHKPVFRAGLNYELHKTTFIRASWGQGYRYPSIAERFVSTSFGASKVFPNPQLQSETGWSAELGVKQGFQLGSWVGNIDAAYFWMRYQNMMEFAFGMNLPPDSSATQVNNPIDYIGFKSINVGDAQINGLDLSLMAQGNIRTIESRIIAGYTLMNPLQLNPDSAIVVNLSGNTNTLKYRYRHTAKFDWELMYKKFTLGNTLLYNSFMQNIDAVFQNTKPEQNVFGVLFEYGTGLPSTVNEFRTKYNKGALLWDIRLGYQFSKNIRLAFVTKNVLNTIYAERPAMVGPIRNFTLQLFAEL